MSQFPLKFDQPQVELQTSQIIQIAQHDLDWFAAICMEDKLFKFPPFYVSMWKVMTDELLTGHRKQDERFALGIPRGFIKTTFFKLLVAWAAVYSRFQFVMVFQATDTQSHNFLSDVADILDNPNFIAVYGDWRKELTTDRLDLKVTKFYGRNLILKAQGKGGSARGIALKNRRPDLFIFDDVQSLDESASPVEWTALKQWINSTVEYLNDPKGCVRLAAGNMYPTETCLMRVFEKSPRWKSFIVGAINEKGESLWEELHPIARLLTQYENAKENGSEANFRAELLNDRDVTRLDSLNLHLTKSEDDLMFNEIAVGGFVIIDPSGSKAKSDNTEIGAFFVYPDNVVLLHKFISGRFTPDQTITHAIDLATEFGLSVIGVEDVAYQASLKFWFDKTLETLNASDQFQILLVSPEGQNKITRILTALRQWERGTLLACDPAYTQIMAQARSFNPVKTNNVDDKLDVFAYGPRFWAKYHAQIPMPIEYANTQLSSLPPIISPNLRLPSY